jgi:hypothetical protein
MLKSSIIIRGADPSEFDIASEFWVSMRRELNMPDEDLAVNWKARCVDYFRRRHDAGELRWFLARRVRRRRICEASLAAAGSCGRCHASGCRLVVGDRLQCRAAACGQQRAGYLRKDGI